MLYFDKVALEDFLNTYCVFNMEEEQQKMKRESVIVIIISTLLNFGWSIVFDLLPNFVDYRQVNISLIRPIYYVVFVLGFVCINLFILLLVRWLMKKFWIRETSIKLIVEAINKQITNEVEELPNKPPQVLPGEDRPVFYHYGDAINQLENKNGWIEFELEAPPPDFDDEQPIFLCEVYPGMHKHFMVVTQSLDEENGIPPYCMIKPDDWGSSAEFSADWYNTLFAIFSSFSKYVSSTKGGPGMEAKKGGPGTELETYYTISKYKFTKNGKKNYLLIRIV